MGKKTSKRKPPAKKQRGKVDTEFTCPFCNHDKSCIVTFDRMHKVGVIKCKVCSEMFQTTTHELSEPIDVFTDWIDACDLAQADAETR